MPLVASSGSQPRVILGLMTFGPDVTTGARITTQEDYKECLDYFQSRGYSEVDTARSYIGGKQEAFTRDAEWQDRGLTLATKCYPRPDAGVTHKPESLRNSLNTSLAELGAKTVDIFYLHAADRNTPFEESLEELDKMHKEGLFVRLGLSNFTAFEVAEVCMLARQRGWVRPTIYQGMYNCITRSLEYELIPCCRRYGLDVVIYNPLAGGLFSGKYSASSMQNIPTEGRYSDSIGRQGSMYRNRYFKDATFAALSMIEPVVKKHNLTMLETAMRWCTHHSKLSMPGTKAEVGGKGNDGVIIGVSSLSQLKSNLDDLEKAPLPQEVLDVLDEAWAVARQQTPNYWHLELKYGYDGEKAIFG